MMSLPRALTSARSPAFAAAARSRWAPRIRTTEPARRLRNTSVLVMKYCLQGRARSDSNEMSNMGSRVAQRFPLRAVSLCLLLAAPACKGGPETDQAAIEERLHEKGTAELMHEVSTAPEYRPPADGRLSERQVRIYLDVRRRERKIREI